MNDNDFIQAFDALFAGRRDVHSAGYPDPKKSWKRRYNTVWAPLTVAVLRAHLKGETEGPIGVYPLQEDNTVSWFAADFDSPKDANGDELADPFSIVWEVAKRQVEAFEAAGLHVYLERSQSGKGVHVWGFLAQPMPARTIRQALKPLITDHAVFDRLFPVQDELTEKSPLGNLIALPFYGKAVAQQNSTFLDPKTGASISPRVFVGSVLRNLPAVIEELAAEAAKREPKPVAARSAGSGVSDSDAPPRDYRPSQPITGALKVLSKYGCPFMHHAWTNRRTLKEPEWYAALGQCTAFQYGRELAHLISRDYPNYSAGEVDAKYDQAMEQPPVGYAWLAENYPTIVGANHGGKAPYHLAKRSILELSERSKLPTEALGSFAPDLERIRRLDAGEMQSGIPWGLPLLDDYVRLRNGELTVIGGMSSLGKTSLLIDGVVRLARAGVHCMVFSAETGPESLRNRFLARIADVDSRALRGERSARLTEGEWKRLRAAARELEALPIYGNYTALGANEVLLQVEHVLLSRQIPLDSKYVCFYDYLQFASRQPGEDSEYDRVSRAASEFKFLAKILDHPVVVFSQVKREKEGDDAPDLTWFKSSGRIENDLDVGMIITGERVESVVAPRKITIVKQREGEANRELQFTLYQDVCRWEPQYEAASDRESKTQFGLVSES